MKKSYSSLKVEAIKLRKKGLSYGSIAKKLWISKSTASVWLRNILLTPNQRKKLNYNQVAHLITGPHSQKFRRAKEIKQIFSDASKEVSNKISMESYRLFGAALYWAEGNKVNDFTISNSDPLLIQFMCKWFCDLFNVTPNDLKAHLNIYPQQNDLEIKKFWSEITGIPIERFGKTFIKPLNKNYKKNTLYYGTIKVRVNKGTNFRYRVFGWIDSVLRNNKINVENIERKWYKLRSDYMRP